jgi:glutathione S-transferase
MQRVFRFKLASFSTRATSNVKLWHSPNARSLRCLWALEEMDNINYELMTMPFPPRMTHRSYLKTNVLGTIPYLEDGDAKMTESCGSK